MRRLLALAAPLRRSPASNEGGLSTLLDEAASEGLRRGLIGLESLLRNSGGFYVFDSALLVRPTSSPSVPLGVLEWNERSVWREAYGTLISSEAICFAEDLFGGQFALTSEGVIGIDCETGAAETIGATLEEWAEQVLSDSDFRTGWSLAREWQARHGPLLQGQRLIPQQPFVLGGDYVLENLKVVDDVRGMRIRAGIAESLAGVPDGEQVVIERSPSTRGPSN